MLYEEQVDDKLASLRMAFDKGKKLAAFGAFVLAREYDRSVPDWALNYLDEAFHRLLFSSEETEGKGPGEIGVALGLRYGLHTSRRDLFARRRVENSHEQLASKLAGDMVDRGLTVNGVITDGQPARPRGTARYHGLSVSTARRILVEAAGRPSDARSLMVEFLESWGFDCPSSPRELVNVYSEQCAKRSASVK